MDRPAASTVESEILDVPQMGPSYTAKAAVTGKLDMQRPVAHGES
jgi:hypothetical protein